jgi:3-hydroxyisobutyrate dehydrogenase
MAEIIGFVGLGNMGTPMVQQLLAAGHRVQAYDVSEDARVRAQELGATVTASAHQVAVGASTILTMLPAGEHVRQVYLGENGLISAAASGSLLIDCSTIDIGTSRMVGTAAGSAGIEMIDAPVTGGIMAARKGALNFIVGGTEAAFERAKPVLACMGKNLLYAGSQGSGIGVKICNNMALGVAMIAAAEALMLAKRLGLDVKRTHQIISNASGQNWALSNYSPLPGLVEGVPSNNGFKPGFTAEMMRKDLRLSQEAAASVNACTPLGGEALSIFSLFCANGDAQTDYSGISKLIGGEAWDYPFSPDSGA